MSLYSFVIKSEESKQTQKVSDKEISTIKKKIRYNKTRFSLVLFTAILIFLVIYSIFSKTDTGLLPMTCVALIFYLPATISTLKKKTIHYCYATVTEKKTRYAKKQSRSSASASYPAYAETESEESVRQKPNLFYAVYYCTIEINGREYENVCCYAKDFANIGIGDKVILSTIYDKAVIFAIK